MIEITLMPVWKRKTDAFDDVEDDDTDNEYWSGSDDSDEESFRTIGQDSS